MIKKVYDELGGLDEDYIYGLEDVDFSLKLHKKGYKTILAPNALLFHHESSTRVKSKDYEDNDKHNYKVFWSKWGNYLSKNMLLDKIHDNKFFTQKKLKITIVDENYHDNFEFLSKISKGFNELGFTVELISDLENMYIGNSSDILLCLSEDYDLENMVARDDIVRVFISQNSKDNPKGYDIVVSDENKTFDSKYNFAIKDNFVKEFLENLEDILIKSDGFFMSFKNRLMSKIPASYILHKSSNKTEAKLIVKGYNAIRKNNLFDDEFYLDIYPKVKASGMDPLLHYIFFGFNEGKKAK